MTYLRNFRPFCLILGFTLCAPFAAKSGAIDVNGTCELGDCSSVDSLSNGMSASANFNFDYTFGDGDTYNISGSYSASYSSITGSTISVEPVITYVGASPSADTDTVNLALLQNYFDSSAGSWAGTYTEDVPLDLGGPVGPGSTISGELFYDGVGVGLAGPFGPGSNFVTESASLDFGANDTSDTLSAAFDFAVQFGAGTQPGASADAVTTPEPMMALPFGLSLILIACGVCWRHRSRIAV
jgi:hypothetical protein